MEISSGLRRKGFVYTLEAIIASSLFLLTVTTLVPDAPAENTLAVKKTVHSGLESLDKSGDLRDDLSIAALETEIEPFIPAGYNHSVRLTRVGTETHRFNSPREFHFDKNGGNTELQLWLEQAENLNVTFRNETVIQDRDSPGYLRKTLPSSQGHLNFTGTGKGEFDFDVYSKKGGIPQSQDLKSVSYVVKSENLTEIRVFLWTG